MLRGKSAIQGTKQEVGSHSSALLRKCVAIATLSATDCKHGRRNEVPTPQLRLRRVHPFHLNVLPRICDNTIFRAFHGAVFSYGSVRFGAVLPNRTAQYDFTSNKTAPNRTVGFSEIKKTHRTAPHRTVLKKYPHRPPVRP